jgi:DNA-binding IscR family transcriptional regulator
MTRSSQLSDILHVLLHMAQESGPTTSESLAAVMNTNPVVLRRLMAGMRHAGFVQSEKGHGGGWVLTCALDRITLGDVHRALGAPRLISLGFREDKPSCLVALSVNDALKSAMRDAESLLLDRLDAISLASLSDDFERRMKAHRSSAQRPAHQLRDHLDEGV